MCNVLTDKSVKDSESIGVKTNGSIKSEGKKDAVSAFGSITAQLMDGMAMSLSQFGETAFCQVWFHLVQLFQRSRLKYEKDDGRQVMAIPHMTLWVR
jgi:hypothetical protein